MGEKGKYFIWHDPVQTTRASSMTAKPSLLFCFLKEFAEVCYGSPDQLS